MGGYTLVVYTRLLWLKSEAADAFKSFRKAENKSGSRLHVVMTDVDSAGNRNGQPNSMHNSPSSSMT